MQYKKGLFTISYDSKVAKHQHFLETIKKEGFTCSVTKQ